MPPGAGLCACYGVSWRSSSVRGNPDYLIVRPQSIWTTPASASWRRRAGTRAEKQVLLCPNCRNMVERTT